MRSISPPLFFLFLFLFLFLFTVFSTASFSLNGTFPGCYRPFSCGHLNGISYPFTGGLRPAHCGPPEFRLTCTNGSFPELTIGSLSFRVIHLDPTNHSMILSRLDLYNSTCLQHFTNTTLNSTFFAFAQGNEEVTLFFGCTPFPGYSPKNHFFCDINGLFDNAYYLIGPVPSDPILGIVNCTVSVTVPILETTVGRLVANRSLLDQVLKEGFNVNYRVPYSDECDTCVDSGGECGFDSGSGQPLCVCGERICASSEAGTILRVFSFS